MDVFKSATFLKFVVTLLVVIGATVLAFAGKVNGDSVLSLMMGVATGFGIAQVGAKKNENSG